jgi:hypothetical protein
MQFLEPESEPRLQISPHHIPRSRRNPQVFGERIGKHDDVGRWRQEHCTLGAYAISHGQRDCRSPK